MKKAQQFSAGAVVYNHDEKGDLKIALIHRKDRDIWCLPKGKLEAGETPQQAAIREVVEETGLYGDLGEEIGDIHYSFYEGEVDIIYAKKVVFYTYQYNGKETERQDKKIDLLKWCGVDEALICLSYAREKDIVKKAVEIIQ